MNNPNPYEAPRATLEIQASDDDDGFLGESRGGVPIGAGAEWLGYGWNAFKEAPLPWIGIFVVFVVMSFLANLIPLVGIVLNSLLGPVLAGGIFLACDGQRRGGGLDFAKLFGGFSTGTAGLLAIGALNLVFTLVTQVGMSAAMYGPSVAVEAFLAMMTGGTPPAPNFDAGRMLGFALVTMVVAIPLAMAMWLAPGLITLNGVAPMDAMRRSLVGCLRNFGTLFVYVLMAIGVGIAATLPCFLGWFVAFPMLFAATYAAYRNFFYD
jgi:uncharacterized membrane protein